MIGTVRGLLAAALLAAPALLLTGCQLDALKVVIPDFDSSEVLGIQVYKRIANTGEVENDWARATRLVFTEPFVAEDGVERMQYDLVADQKIGEFYTVVDRDPDDPDRVTVSIVFTAGPGTNEVRVATYNAAGESPFSAESLTL